jgi:hypothetical protein
MGQGTIGFVLNIVLFIFLLAVEPNRITLTEGEQHWRKLVVTFFGCVLNFLLACSAVGLTFTLSTKVADYSPLIAPLICTYIQGYVAYPVVYLLVFSYYDFFSLAVTDLPSINPARVLMLTTCG